MTVSGLGGLANNGSLLTESHCKEMAEMSHAEMLARVSTLRDVGFHYFAATLMQEWRDFHPEAPAPW